MLFISLKVRYSISVQIKNKRFFLILVPIFYGKSVGQTEDDEKVVSCVREKVVTKSKRKTEWKS